MLRDRLDVLRCPRSGQPLSLEATESVGDDVAYGMLTSEAGTYPVVSGIPVFTRAGQRAVAEVRKGRPTRATAEVFCASSQGSRSWRLATAMAASQALRGTVRLSGETLRRRQVDGVTELLADRDVGILDILDGAFLRGGPAMTDAHDYFHYRLGTPRHLVVLSLLESLPAPGGLVGDFGCGAGHLSWAIATRWPSAGLVAMDSDFRLLLAARLMIGDGATLVCADVTRAPIASGAFEVSISCDVLSYVEDKWSAVREMERTLASPGTLAVTSVKDSAAEHVFAGLPLSVAGWRGLVGHLDHRVIADDQVVARYLDGKGLPADDVEPSDGASQLVTLVAGRGRLDLAGDRDLADWPHARGPLGLNPLYQPTGDDGTFQRRLPDGVYVKDNLAVKAYLPATVHLDDDVLAAARRGERPSALDPLVATTAVLAYPDAYNADRWPAPSTDGSARP